MAEFRETLISPDGREVEVTSPGEYNDLRYGLGYRPPEKSKPKAKTEKSTQSDTKQ